MQRDVETDGGAGDPVLRTIDRSLLRMRRMWLSPASHAQMERDVGGGIPLSVVLVVDAVHRGPVDDHATPEDDPNADDHPTPDDHGAPPGRPEPRREVTVADIATRLQVNPSTASRLVEGARGAGYVERGSSTVDARRSVLELTPSGHELLRRAGDFRRSHLERLLAGFSAEERAAFAVLLGRFADAVVASESG